MTEAELLDRFRIIRLHHYRKALRAYARSEEQNAKGRDRLGARERHKGNLHTRHVETLNELFAPDDTAEKDLFNHELVKQTEGES